MVGLGGLDWICCSMLVDLLILATYCQLLDFTQPFLVWLAWSRLDWFRFFSLPIDLLWFVVILDWLLHVRWIRLIHGEVGLAVPGCLIQFRCITPMLLIGGLAQQWLSCRILVTLGWLLLVSLGWMR